MTPDRSVTVESPLEVCSEHVLDQVAQDFGHLPLGMETVYVSTPITTGHRFFERVRAGDRPTRAERAVLRSANAAHAREVIVRVRRAFAPRTVIDPLFTVAEPEGWGQLEFHGYWMTVVDRYVGTFVMCDGWAFSTGCTWELGRALLKGCEILDERLHRLERDVLLAELEQASHLIASASWRAARSSVLEALGG